MVLKCHDRAMFGNRRWQLRRKQLCRSGLIGVVMGFEYRVGV